MFDMINLTPNKATPEQIADGVTEIDECSHALVKKALTFNGVEDIEGHSLKQRVADLIAIATCFGANSAMVDGAPYFLPILVESLKKVGITPRYSFSVKEIRETTNEDGTVTKTEVLKHIKFIDA